MRLGLDRVCWVRVVRRGGHVRAEVAGILRRRPVVRLVPLAVATSLVSRGVPVVVTGERPDELVGAVDVPA